MYMTSDPHSALVNAKSVISGGRREKGDFKFGRGSAAVLLPKPIGSTILICEREKHILFRVSTSVPKYIKKH